jgi:hypothetical protein
MKPAPTRANGCTEALYLRRTTRRDRRELCRIHPVHWPRDAKLSCCRSSNLGQLEGHGSRHVLINTRRLAFLLTPRAVAPSGRVMRLSAPRIRTGASAIIKKWHQPVGQRAAGSSGGRPIQAGPTCRVCERRPKGRSCLDRHLQTQASVPSLCHGGNLPLAAALNS